MTKQRLTAIIAEFNPYHLGHRYLLEQAKEMGDDILIIMSGSFVQRGDVAILDPYTRAKWAISEGANLVLELPFSGAAAPADKFAEFAFKLLDGIDAEITLLFGSEDGNIDRLTNTAKLLFNEPIEIKTALQQKLDNGLPYPKALDESLREYAFANSLSICDISQPNNALGIEYCKANLRRREKYTLKTIKRQGDYKSKTISTLPSATAIRNLIETNNKEAVCPLVPNIVYSDLNLLDKRQDSSILFVQGLQSKSNNELKEIFDVNEGLENRLLKAVKSSHDYNTMLSEAATKRYTTARIKRIATYALLGYTKEDASIALTEEPLYNILACDKDSKRLLSIFSNKPYFSQSELANDKRVQAQFTYKAHNIGKLFWGYHLIHCDFK